MDDFPMWVKIFLIVSLATIVATQIIMFVLMIFGMIETLSPGTIENSDIISLFSGAGIGTIIMITLATFRVVQKSDAK